MDELARFPVVVELPVCWGEMDAYQHVNNVVYFRYFENARLEYFRRLDWFALEKETGIGPILAATDGRFRKALTYPDRIRVGVRVLLPLGEDRFNLEYCLWSERLQAVAATGGCLIVTYRYQEGQKAAIPDELRQRIEALEATAVRGDPL